MNETVGQRLRRLRVDSGRSQRELASPGVTYAYISRIEAGTRDPSVKALRKLAAALGVTADYLETGEDALLFRISGETIDRAAAKWGVRITLAELTDVERAQLEAKLYQEIESAAGGAMLALATNRHLAALPFDDEPSQDENPPRPRGAAS